MFLTSMENYCIKSEISISMEKIGEEKFSAFLKRKSLPSEKPIV